MFPGLKFSNSFALEARHSNIDIVKQMHEHIGNNLLETIHLSKIVCDPVVFEKHKVQPILTFFRRK